MSSRLCHVPDKAMVSRILHKRPLQAREVKGPHKWRIYFYHKYVILGRMQVFHNPFDSNSTKVLLKSTVCITLRENISHRPADCLPPTMRPYLTGGPYIGAHCFRTQKDSITVKGDPEVEGPDMGSRATGGLCSSREVIRADGGRWGLMGG